MHSRQRRFWDRVGSGTAGIALFGMFMACSAPRAGTPPEEGSKPKDAAAKQPEEIPVYTGSFTKPSMEELRAKLTPLQYAVTQKDDTEPPFRNTYWDNHEAGIYVDIVSGEPLFSSLDKFDSGTGWPSFSRPLEQDSVSDRTDLGHGMTRTEVRSKQADSHLGHVFDDGPAPTGLRYCINSASLRFVPVDKLEAAGYGKYRAAFEKDVKPANP